MIASDVAAENPEKLVDFGIIDAAEAHLAAMRLAREAALADVEAADAGVSAALSMPDALLRAAAAGTVVTDAEVLAAELAIPAARAVAVFRRRFVDEICDSRVRSAQLMLRRAVDKAFLPVLERGIALRAAAVELGDEARAAPGRAADPEKAVQAKAAFDAANAKFLDFVRVNTTLLVGYSPLRWPVNLAQETTAWRGWRAARCT